MRRIQVPAPKSAFEAVPQEPLDPPAGSVRIKVEACGVCHSDSLVAEGLMPGIAFPRVPGHEVVGVIDALGAGVAGWNKDDRVGVGWHGGHCGYCDACRRGNFFACRTETRITGLTHDGGYASFMLARAEALAAVPAGMSPTDAAPLMCAGVTTFNCLRNSGARAGELVAVHGLGGLGHLGVQFASKMGFRTAAIARGKDKEPLARELGAHHYIDAQASDPSAELAKLGGASVIIATVTDAQAMQSVIGGLAINGSLMIIGAVHTLTVPPLQLLSYRQSVKGWYSGTSIDSQDTLAFAALTGVRSMNEVLPMDRAGEGYQRMMSGKARFRVVLAAA